MSWQHMNELLSSYSYCS